MNIESYIQTGLGIFVSVGLSIIAYRQTIGAKKERIHAANLDMEKILLRRIVVENYDLSLEGLRRFIEGKARDARVVVEDLLSEEQVLNLIYTRILETDLITHQQRSALLKRLVPLLKSSENLADSAISSGIASSAESTNHPDKNRNLLQILVAALSVVAGLFVATAGKIDFSKDSSTVLSVLGLPLTLIFASVSLLYLFRRFKDAQNAVSLSSRSVSLQAMLDFEKMVASMLSKKTKILKVASVLDRGFDFLIEYGNKKFFVEIKSWRQNVPLGIVSRTVDMLMENLKSEPGSRGVIVTKESIPYPEKHLKGKPIEIVSFESFKLMLSN